MRSVAATLTSVVIIAWLGFGYFDPGGIFARDRAIVPGLTGLYELVAYAVNPDGEVVETNAIEIL